MGIDGASLSCRCEVEGKGPAGVQTQNCQSGTSPVWDEVFQLQGYAPGDALVFVVEAAGPTGTQLLEARWAADQLRGGCFQGEFELGAGQAALRVRIAAVDVP